jgi:hypothetical protein
MPARTTLSSSAIPQTAHPSRRPGSRHPRLTAAAAVALAAAVLGAVAVGDEGDGASATARPAAESVIGERPDIDPRKAAENFHHRR